MRKREKNVLRYQERCCVWMNNKILFDFKKLKNVYIKCGWNSDKISDITGVPKGYLLSFDPNDNSFSDIYDVKFISVKGTKKKREIHIVINCDGEIKCSMIKQGCDMEDFRKMIDLYNEFLVIYREYIIFI